MIGVGAQSAIAFQKEIAAEDRHPNPSDEQRQKQHHAPKLRCQIDDQILRLRRKSEHQQSDCQHDERRAQDPGHVGKVENVAPGETLPDAIPQPAFSLRIISHRSPPWFDRLREPGHGQTSHSNKLPRAGP